MRSELTQRVISGVIFGATVIFITWWHPISFGAMCLLGGVILWKEWRNLTRARGTGWAILGICYIAAAMVSLIALRQRDEGMMLIYLLFALVWAGDIGGYVVGKLIGKHKIAPSISPGKSWEGLAGSIGFTALVLYALSNTSQFHWPWWAYAVIAGVISILGLAGDLFESSLKRRAGVKDSGTLIPGHGGLFDRVDALMPVAILFATLYYFVPMMEH